MDNEINCKDVLKEGWNFYAVIDLAVILRFFTVLIDKSIQLMTNPRFLRIRMLGLISITKIIEVNEVIEVIEVIEVWSQGDSFWKWTSIISITSITGVSPSPSILAPCTRDAIHTLSLNYYQELKWGVYLIYAVYLIYVNRVIQENRVIEVKRG